MKLGRLNHVGIATPNIAGAVRFYREMMGAQDIGEPFDMAAQGVRVCFVNTPGNGTQIELLEPLGSASPISKFLERNPHGGQHHMAYEVPDIHTAFQYFTAHNRRVIGGIRIGAHGTPMFFLHPGDMQGILTEIMEAPTDHG